MKGKSTTPQADGQTSDDERATLHQILDTTAARLNDQGTVSAPFRTKRYATALQISGGDMSGA